LKADIFLHHGYLLIDNAHGLLLYPPRHLHRQLQGVYCCWTSSPSYRTVASFRSCRRGKA
jgi:hypothetical protein